MTDKVVVITGGSRGIGRAAALAAAARGYRVVIGYASDKAATAAEIRANGGTAESRGIDLTDRVALLALAEEAGPVDALVNNAGIVGKSGVRVEDMTAARIQEVMAVNVTGAILCAREAVKRMSTKFGGKGGAIVNISSVASVLGSPNEYVDYAASKGADR